MTGSADTEAFELNKKLRGRSGREGNPGSTRFYLSLQDDLMRIFASDRAAGLMKKLVMVDAGANKAGINSGSV